MRARALAFRDASRKRGMDRVNNARSKLEKTTGKDTQEEGHPEEVNMDSPSRKRLLELINLLLPRDKTAAQIIALLDNLRSLRPGRTNADAFKELVADVFDTVFEGDLHRLGTEISQGRTKRIDIVFQNRSRNRGLFHDLPAKYLIPCAHIPIETKCYSGDPGNPAINQLLGYFNDFRGRVGFLVSFSITNRRRLLLRCQESAHNNSGWIIPLDCSDLAALLEAKILSRLFNEPDLVWDILDRHFQALAFGQ
jgi:hypothetical protein